MNQPFEMKDSPLVDAALQHRVEQFLYAEARLLNDNDWTRWLALFTEDGMYWVPREHGQSDPHDHISLFWEDALLRSVRVRRLTNPRNWSQQPPSRSTRVVGNVTVVPANGSDELVVHSTFQMIEWRKREPRLYGGACTHTLVPEGDDYRIKLKRVDLVDCDRSHENLQVFF